MTEQYLCERIDDDHAVLHDGDGRAFTVPASWLPEGTQAGVAVRVRRRGGAGHPSLDIDLVAGDVPPDRESVGG